jgi:hypothetical protein
LEPIEDWQLLWGDEDHDASGDAWLSLDEAGALEAEDHLMDGRWGDAEVALHVGFGRGSAEDARIDVDEGQVVALLFGEALRVPGA